MKSNPIWMAALRTVQTLAAVLGILILAALFSGLANAQQLASLPISSGSETGSYFRFIKEAANVCQDMVRVENRASAGSTQNLDRLEANDVSLSIVQDDILTLYSNTKDMSNVRVLVPLFPEQLHFVTRADSGKKEGGFGVGQFRVGSAPVVFNTIKDLNGRSLAAAGGSHLTAQVVSQIGGLGFQLTNEKSADDVMAKVAAGIYDAGLLVCSQPCGTINNNPNVAKLKLLPVPDEISTKLSKIYSRGNPLNYDKMGDGGRNVATLQVNSSLITQNYKRGVRADAVAKLRECLWERAEEQAGTPGTHPAWRNVKPNATSNWPMWEYIQANPSGRPAPANAKKS